MTEDQFWIKDPGDTDYRKVDRAEYVRVERTHGFTNTMGRPDEPATAAFTAPDGTRGTTQQPADDAVRADQGIVSLPAYYIAGHPYYDYDGKPITVQQWGRLREQPRTIQESPITLPDSTPAQLVTMWLGMVEPSVYDARLYGTAIITDSATINQIEVHDTKAQARQRHADHRFASSAGYHCARCKDGQPHHA